MLKFLSKDDIVKADDIVTEPVEVPEWGGQVMVRGLTGVERDDWEASRIDRRAKRKKGSAATEIDHTNFRASLCARSICNEAGELLFGEKDVTALGRKSAAALERVFTVAMRLAGLTDEDIDELAEDLDDEGSGDSHTS